MRILKRVGGSRQAEQQMREIEEAIAQESGSVFQLLQPGLRFVLLIGVVLAVLQQVTGINVILYYAPEIFKQMGAEMSSALGQTIVVGAVMWTLTLVAIWKVDRLGRRGLLMVGTLGMGVALVAFGLTAFLGGGAVMSLIFVLCYIACFSVAMGPVVWVVLSEIFPTSIRGRAMAISALCLWGANYVVSQTFPMMSENEWLLNVFGGAFPFWIYAGLCFLTVWFVWRFLPETKGRTLEEIEKHWLGAGALTRFEEPGERQEES
jgi:sugar porter (SP) family MFS transporter